jgi:putative ABC transport system permease protein
MQTLWQDLRYGFRMLAKSPGFTIVAVLSLALGIGANTTIFSVINAVMLRPLPYENVDRWVAVFETMPERGQTRDWAATANFLDWEKQNQVFDRMELIAGGPDTVTLSGFGETERIGRQALTPGLFRSLGIRTVLGRTFLPEDDLGHTIVLSHDFWQRRFGSDRKLLGQTLHIDGIPYVVIGVLSPGFQFWLGSWEIDCWEAIDFKNPDWINRSVHWLFAMARLKPGVTLEQAQSAMDNIAHQLAQAYPDTNKGRGVKLEPLHRAVRAAENYGEVLYPLFGAVAFVLMIACTNIANLLLARASTRQKEIAVRSSLGAGKFRLVRQMLTESVLLALMGGLLGLFLSVWGIEIFITLAPEWFAHIHQITINTRVLAFTLVVSILSGILFGLAPAWQSSKPNLNETLKEGGRTSAGASRHRTRSALVVTEVALALVLLIGAGLMINSFLRLQRVKSGFHPENLLTAEVYLGGPKYLSMAPKREIDMNRISPQVGTFCHQVLERLNALPGVLSAAMIDFLPTTGWGYPVDSFTILGRPVPPQGQQPVVEYKAVSPTYFKTMQIPLLRGRDLTERDVEASPWVVVINRAMAEKFWPNEDPIGQVVTLGTVREERPREIVGVVENVHQAGLAQEPKPEMYLPYLQQLDICLGNRKMARLHKSLVIRAASPSAELTTVVRRAVAEVDKDQAVYGFRSMNQVLANSTSPYRFYMLLLGIFAGVALVLAGIGIYGVISYSVTERTHEIGIRLALGAQPQEVLALMLKHGLILSLIGVVLGLAASFAATRVLSSFLFAVTAHDPITFSVVSLVLIMITLLATYLPARRATKVDPVVALRYE